MPVDNVTVSLVDVDTSVLDDVVYFVEATRCERHLLWQENKRQGYVEWEEAKLPGFFIQVGQLSLRKSKTAIMVEFEFVRLNGLLVAFFEATSLIVDHSMVREWFKNHYPYTNTTDANNFGNCLNFIRGIEVPAVQITLYDCLKDS